MKQSVILNKSGDSKFLILCIILLIFLPILCFANIDVYLDQDTYNVRVGETFIATVMAYTGMTDTLHLAETIVSFDPNILEITWEINGEDIIYNIYRGTFLRSGTEPGGGSFQTWPYYQGNNSAGWARSTEAILGPWGVTGTGSLSYIEFEVIGEGPTTLTFSHLYMTDNHANSISATGNNSVVYAGEYLWAEFEGNPTISENAPLTVNFTDLSLPGDYVITNWNWNFGDGQTSSAQNPEHVYQYEGIYTVSLTVTDAISDSDTETKVDYIRIGAPSAEFQANPISGDAPLEVTFTDLSTLGASDIIEWDWDFGDGNTSSDQNPIHIYQNEGFFTVSLTVTDGNYISDTETKTDYILVGIEPENPEAEFSGEPRNGYAPLIVNFTDLSTPGIGSIVVWNWDFGDGTISTEQNPEHTYTTPGYYTVSLEVMNSSSLTDQMTKVNYITVDPSPLFAAFSANPTVGPAPLVVHFTDESYEAKGIVSWEWDFGDGGTSYEQNPTHTFYNNGVYTISLQVENESEIFNIETKENYIMVGTPPEASFIGVPTSGFAPLEVQFTDQSSSGNSSVVEWFWDFDNNGTIDSYIQNPIYTYSIEGVYSVCLAVKDSEGLVDTMRRYDYITVYHNPFTAEFSATPLSGNIPLDVQFIDQSASPNSEINSWLWNFGDGLTSSNQNPSHRYSNPGIYTVQLTITNESGGLTSKTKENYITAEGLQSYAYPNPLYGPGEIIIKFKYEGIETPTVNIHDVSGRIIKTFQDADIQSDSENYYLYITWNIKDDGSENDVDNGIYYYAISNKSSVMSKGLFAILR